MSEEPRAEGQSGPKLRAIGRILKDEESRFIGYAEIERKTKELGFGMTVRTLRFYVDEGILPPPKKQGKTPVYEEDWILNALLSVHLMKTRLNRSLTEIRTILGRLQEDPSILADKLSVLYEEYAREGGPLQPLERAGLIDAFFDLLTGRTGEARQASEVRLAELVDTIKTGGRWQGDAWTPPPAVLVLASQGARPPTGERPEAAHPTEVSPAETRPSPPAQPCAAADADAPPDPLPAPGPPVLSGLDELGLRAPPPEGAVLAERARALEETFIQRFEANFERVGRVHCPLDGKAYKAGQRERSILRRDRAGEVVELMKRHRVYDRSLLDAIPLDEAREVHVFQRGLFGRGELKVVVAALCLSPLETFVRQRWAEAPLGPLDVERTIDGLVLKEDIFHFVGILSTLGWSPELRGRELIPSRRNLLVCLVESAGGTAWLRHVVQDARWGGVERVFDPETDREKVDRVKAAMKVQLKPKGEFLILANLEADLDLPGPCVRAAVDELLAEDAELSVVTSGGREIIKRRRL